MAAAKGRQVASAPEKPAEAQEARKSTLFTRSLAEQGPNLPIGLIGPDGKLHKTISTLPWRTKEEREIAKNVKPNMAMGAHVSIVLALLTSQFGFREWGDKEKLGEKTTFIGTAFMADVLYAYVWLRREALGDEIVLNLTCTSCEKPFKFHGDLGSVEVRGVEEVADLDWFYDLRNPVKLRGTTVKRFRCNQPRWASVARAQVHSQSEGKILAARGCIAGINDDAATIVLADNEIDELSKFDLEALTGQLNKDFIGPKMAVEGECENCGNEFLVPIDWEYNRFFSTSSR